MGSVRVIRGQIFGCGCAALRNPWSKKVFPHFLQRRAQFSRGIGKTNKLMKTKILQRTFLSLTAGFRIALLLVIGGAFLLPGNARAQGRTFPDVLGHYRGFFQSIGDPDVRGSVELNINFQDPPDPDFQGSITVLGNTYAIRGEVDNNGNLEFNSDRGGAIRGEGKWQDLTRGGALLLATYRLSSGDRGKVDVLRNFIDPPEPDTPPDIAGHWRGTFESGLSLMRGADEWLVQQDRTETGAPGTGFMGQETMDTSIYDFVGTIDGQGNFVRIGNSARGLIVNSGKFHLGLQEPPEPDLQSHTVLNFVDGGLDDLVIVITR
jgi:hypothetical protein